MIELSPTSINMFLRCQLQFQFRYIEGVKSPPSPAMIVGRAVHKALEENFKHKVETYKDLNIEDVIDIYSNAFEEYSQEVEKWEVDKGHEKDTGANLIRVYMSEIAKNIHPDTVEEKIEISISEDLVLIGYRDLKTVEGSTIDLKTTNSIPKEIPFDHKIQIQIYALKGDTLNSEIHYLIKNKTPQVKIIKNTNTTSSNIIIDIAKKIKEQIKKGIFIPTGLSHQWACNYCGYQNICPYKGGL